MMSHQRRRVATARFRDAAAGAEKRVPVFEKYRALDQCPDAEVSFILGVCGECAKAKALDASQDIVDGLGPAERFGVGIGGLDVSLDGFFELGDRAEHASFQGTLGQQREEAFDLIDPRR